MEKKGKVLWQSLRMFAWMTVLTGLIYPLMITAIAQIGLKETADGSFIVSNGKIIGSRLIAQKFEDDKYFWPRPSANDYNPLASGGSNLGPTSEALKKVVAERKAHISKAQGFADASLVPPELVFASGSGLDPHISRKAAYYQIDRIVKARNIEHHSGSSKSVQELIDNTMESRNLRFLGEPYVNVLLLNLALDAMQEKK